LSDSGNIGVRLDNQIKSFYEHIDRANIYTTESALDKHPFFPLLKDFIDKWLLANKKCLEIGSSKGLFQNLVADYTGVDVAEGLKSYYHKPYVIVSDARLPFPAEHFDAVFTYATHEHIPEIELALKEMVRVLKPGGVCLLAPAWHTRSWFAQGYAVRPYSGLSVRGKFIKLSIPFRDFFLFRWTIVLFRRIFRLLLYAVSSHPVPLRYKKLKANYDKFWQSDSDACNSLDPFDIILWFRSRKFICHGYDKLLKLLFVRTSALEIQKPKTPGC
jgi:SAM-dependent methyltransferase